MLTAFQSAVKGFKLLTNRIGIATEDIITNQSVVNDSHESDRGFNRRFSTVADWVDADVRLLLQLHGALAFSEPEIRQQQIKGIVESTYNHRAEIIVTPCPVCQ